MRKYFLLLSLFLVFFGCSLKEEAIYVPQKTLPIALPKEIQKEPPREMQKQILSIPEEKKKYRAYMPMLMFHYIKDVSPESTDQMGYKLSFSPEKLEQFLIFFQENNIKTLTFWDLKEIIEGEKKAPEKAVFLTFDDGYLDHYTNAFRMLKKYNAKGTFFIITEKPDHDPNYATWDQIKEMAEDGQEIGSHSKTHPNLSNLSFEQIQEELRESKKKLEEKIQKPIISFCYPAGEYDNRVLKIVKEEYLFARTTSPGKYFSLQRRFEIPTTRIFPSTGINSLKIWFGVE